MCELDQLKAMNRLISRCYIRVSMFPNATWSAVLPVSSFPKVREGGSKWWGVPNSGGFPNNRAVPQVQTFPHVLVYDWDLQKHAKIQWEEIEE